MVCVCFFVVAVNYYFLAQFLTTAKSTFSEVGASFGPLPGLSPGRAPGRSKMFRDILKIMLLSGETPKNEFLQ